MRRCKLAKTSIAGAFAHHQTPIDVFCRRVRHGGCHMTPLAGFFQSASTDTAVKSAPTTTPGKHAIFIIGENRTFELFSRPMCPSTKGENVRNLLSDGIVKTDGTPAPNYSSVCEHQAVDAGTAQQAGLYQISSTTDKQSYSTLPAPLAGGPAVPYVVPLAPPRHHA